jgi:iron(III) transport system ATP-binding protein
MTDLDITALTKSYPKQAVLHGIDLHVAAGTLTAVLGPSGCGKTTLLRLIAGFDRPDAGVIRLGGDVVTSPGNWTPPHRRRVGYVAQEGALFPHLTVAANICFGLPWRARRTRVRLDELLDLVGLDRALRDRHPHELSGGQQQRVALARALAPRPEIVLLDEPFSALDTALRDSTRRAITAALAATNTTTILVTHDQTEALSLADRVAVMRAGRLIQVAEPSELYRSPADLELAAFLGTAVTLPAAIADGLAETALGVVTVRRPYPPASNQVLIRPEQIVLTQPAPGNLLARVRGITYYGHDATVELELPDETVTARIAGDQAATLGEQVSVAFRGIATAY